MGFAQTSNALITPLQRPQRALEVGMIKKYMDFTHLALSLLIVNIIDVHLIFLGSMRGRPSSASMKANGRIFATIYPHILNFQQYSFILMFGPQFKDQSVV